MPLGCTIAMIIPLTKTWAIEADFRYYYDCLMAPNARSVLSALKRMGELGNNYRRRVTVPVAPQC